MSDAGGYRQAKTYEMRRKRGENEIMRKSMENVRYRDLFFFPLHNLAITKKLPIVFK
jgi:hypothetical protein